MTIIEIESVKQWNETISKTGGGEQAGGVVVAKFGAEWCGPCRALANPLEKLSNEFENATFVSIDIDALPSIAEKLDVSSVPAVFVIRGGEIFKRTVGAGASTISELRGVLNALS